MIIIIAMFVLGLVLGAAIGWATGYEIGWGEGWFDKGEGRINPTRHWWGGKIEEDGP